LTRARISTALALGARPGNAGSEALELLAIFPK
jgi:hypothetical protein